MLIKLWYAVIKKIELVDIDMNAKDIRVITGFGIS